MIRLLISGGLGNQLFQYAAVRAQAKRIGAELAIDPLFHQQSAPHNSYSLWLQTLPIRARIIKYQKVGPLSAHGIINRGYRKFVRPAFWHRYTQPRWGEDRNFFDIPARTIVSGDFQSLFYLMPRDEEILSEISLWEVMTSEAAALARSIEAGRFVSLHVRRGDYLKYPIFNHIDYCQYASAAMDLIRQKLGKVTFLVFSNDVDWCKKSNMFGKDCEFMEANQFGPNPAIDQLFMSVCSHHIIANSSYSWWAAWANFNEEKICIAPRNWVRNYETRTLGLAYPTWITL